MEEPPPTATKLSAPTAFARPYARRTSAKPGSASRAPRGGGGGVGVSDPWGVGGGGGEPARRERGERQPPEREEEQAEASAETAAHARHSSERRAIRDSRADGLLDHRQRVD